MASQQSVTWTQLNCTSRGSSVPILEKGTSDLQAPNSRTPVPLTPKVNFLYSFAEYYQRANINLARKWREWRLAENLTMRQAQSSRPSLVTTSPQQVDAGIRWLVQYIEAMLARYTTLNVHAEWRWRVYQSKQREVERACLGTQTTTAVIHATTDHGSFWTAQDAILGGTGMCVEP
ncbi:hypothetical protein BJ742DRAFT_872317 [Cladochytrium replicatum]|nr:hypothetical protein BJ742DRAFT_872317 [Cladochytrium replicatum]